MNSKLKYLFVLAAIALLCGVASAEVYPDPPCIHYEGVCGDLDGDYNANISDAVYLLQYIFAGGPEPAQMWSGDCNLDGHVNIIDAVYIVCYIFGGGPSPCAGTDRSGYSGGSPFYSCIEWEYDGVGLLQITHTNSGFNCCPDEIVINMMAYSSSIDIVESEHIGPAGPCPCMCLYNLTAVETGVARSVYWVEVEEPYLMSGDEPLYFYLDLTQGDSGSHCVYRSKYPWGEPW